MMLKKSVVFLLVILAIALMSMSGCAEQKVATDEDMCQSVFQAIQSNDGASYAAMLITDENIKELVVGLDETNPKEKSIKEELSSGLNAEKFNVESMTAFNDLIKKAKLENLDLSQASYLGVFSGETRYETGSHNCKTIKFRIGLSEDLYEVRVGVFQTEKSMFLYDEMRLIKLVNYQFKLESPTENPVTIKAGSSLDLAVGFNSEAANKAGAWIETRYDGKGGGMYYDSSMTSPYASDIPSKYLTVGTHVIEFLLQPSGSNTDNPLAKVKLDIIVE